MLRCLLLTLIWILPVFNFNADSVDSKNKSEGIPVSNKVIELNQSGILILQSNPVGAMNFFKQAHELAPQVPDYANNVGVALLNQKKFQEALIYFIKANEIEPNYVRGYYNQGICYQNLAENEKSIKAYSKAVKLSPNFYEAYYNLGLVNMRLGNEQEAINNFKTFIKLAPAELEKPIQDANSRIKELSKK